MNTFNCYVLFPLLLVVTACQPKSDTPSNTIIISTEEVNIAHGLIQGAFDDLWGGLDSTKILEYHTDDFSILEQGEVWDNQMIKNYIVFANSGQQICAVSSNETKASIPLEPLQSGIYLVTIETDNGQRQTFRFVKP